MSAQFGGQFWSDCVRRQARRARLPQGGCRETALVGLAAQDEASEKVDIRGIEKCTADHTKKFGDLLDASEHEQYAKLTQGLRVSQPGLAGAVPIAADRVRKPTAPV